jgi:hypothetical protein
MAPLMTRTSSSTFLKKVSLNSPSRYRSPASPGFPQKKFCGRDDRELLLEKRPVYMGAPLLFRGTLPAKFVKVRLAFLQKSVHPFGELR